jgi:pimeloyl-ACP methyl ester carboxylesterase
MHGVNRDADRYLAEWAPLAERYGFILIVPEFDRARFPGATGYNTGFFQGPDGRPRTREKWSFAALEPLFDEVRVLTGTAVERYALYGHSAGAQFVHRYVLFVPEARLSRAIAANAGWYTWPDLTTPYPYGLAASSAGENELKRALGKPLTILLGTADTDIADPNLRTTREANAQGAHRLARGANFHTAGRASAARLGVPFAWQLEYVENTGHHNGAMAYAAAPMLVR